MARCGSCGEPLVAYGTCNKVVSRAERAPQDVPRQDRPAHLPVSRRNRSAARELPRARRARLHQYFRTRGCRGFGRGPSCEGRQGGAGQRAPDFARYAGRNPIRWSVVRNRDTAPRHARYRPSPSSRCRNRSAARVSAGGRTRTGTILADLGILSPVRLPFRHSGVRRREKGYGGDGGDRTHA